VERDFFSFKILISQSVICYYNEAKQLFYQYFETIDLATKLKVDKKMSLGNSIIAGSQLLYYKTIFAALYLFQK